MSDALPFEEAVAAAANGLVTQTQKLPAFLARVEIYQDSPVLIKDRVTEGCVRTSSTAPGQAADRADLERVAAATVINDASRLYNAERCQDSLTKFQEAGAMNGGDQIRTHNGVYLNQLRLGKATEAEAAFGQIVANGLRHNKLDVKFFFNPGTTNFWSDPRISGNYAMWLRQIAKESAAAKVCMKVVGHTSKTGSDALNDTLSMQRAAFILQRLAAEAPPLAQRTKPAGMGSRENLVGTGSDNAADAPDRRVEFRVEAC